MVTCRGETFASRVAASLNHHMGLGELNAPSDQSYVELAVELARHSGKLNSLRLHVADARTSAGLFDMAGYARDFEALLAAMFKRHEAGYDAADIELEP